jgi:hypothetical protein
MRTLPLLAILALACAGEKPEDSSAQPTETGATDSTPPDTDTDTDADTDTDTDADTDTDTDTEDTEPPLAILGADCVVQPDNLLRYDCMVATNREASIDVTFTPDAGGRERSTPATEGTEHLATAWGMAAGASYTWTATATAGDEVVTSDPVAVTMGMPTFAAAIELDLATTATPTTQGLLTNIKCAEEHAMAIFDEAGQVVWYDVTVPDSFYVDGAALTADGTIAAIYDSVRLVETALDGTVVRDWTSDDIGHYLHHEVHIQDGVAWLLVLDPMTLGGGETVVNGVILGLDPDLNEVGRWGMDSHIPPVERECISPWGEWFPGACDPYDANAFGLDENGDWLLSLKTSAEVYKIRGPGAPQAGDIVWSLFADGTGSLTSVGGAINPVFEGQHHTTSPRPGVLMMFDNLGPDNRSRVLQFQIDEGAQTATPILERLLPAECARVGSAYEYDDGHILATCGTGHTFYEFDNAGQIIWEMDARCPDTAANYRGVPIPLDDL